MMYGTEARMKWRVSLQVILLTVTVADQGFSSLAPVPWKEPEWVNTDINFPTPFTLDGQAVLWEMLDEVTSHMAVMSLRFVANELSELHWVPYTPGERRPLGAVKVPDDQYDYYVCQYLVTSVEPGVAIYKFFPSQPETCVNSPSHCYHYKTPTHILVLRHDLRYGDARVKSTGSAPVWDCSEAFTMLADGESDTCGLVTPQLPQEDRRMHLEITMEVPPYPEGYNPSALGLDVTLNVGPMNAVLCASPGLTVYTGADQGTSDFSQCLLYPPRSGSPSCDYSCRCSGPECVIYARIERPQLGVWPYPEQLCEMEVSWKLD